MKLPLLITALFLSCSTARADWQIVQKGEHKGKEEEITISIRDTLVRYDRPARKLSWLTDVSTGDTILFVDEAQRYQRFSAEEVAKTRAEQREKSTPVMKQEGGKPKATGTKASPVAGWKTSQHTWQHPVGINMTLWVATTPQAAKLGSILQKAEDANPLGAPLLPGTPRHEDFKGMIMRYELGTTKGGASKNTVVSVKEEKLPGKLFEVPATYKELKKD